MKKDSVNCFRIIISLVCYLSVNITYSQWPQWRGRMRDGISTEVNLLKVWPTEGPKLLWSADTIGDGFSSAAIQDMERF